MFHKLFLLLLSLTLSIHALTTPHAGRSIHHRAIAARVPVPNPVQVISTPRKRQSSSRRCKPRQAPSSSSRAPEATTKAQDPATTSKAQEPTTTTRPREPATTSTTKRTTTTKAPEPTSPPKSSPNLPSFMIGTQTGQGTFYATGLGACGITNSDSDYIAAVSHLLFDNFPGYAGGNPNKNPICRKKVRATYRGKSVTVEITDRCEGCSVSDLDFSPTAFNQIADFAVGRISDMTWEWL